MLCRVAITLMTTVLAWASPLVAQDARPVIVTSFTIIQDWVHNVAGEQVKVINLVPARSETHGYQLSPADARELRRATLIVGMNPALESWLEGWAKANQRDQHILWLFPEQKGDPSDHCAANPHAWIDPRHVKLMLERLAVGLQRANPAIKLQGSYHEYLKEVERVDEALAKLFAGLPAERRTFISQHANLQFFAARYGLLVADTILKSGSAEAADPSARHFSDLLALIRKHGIRVIVTDAGQNESLARRLAEDTGQQPPLPLSFEYLEPRGLPGDTWITMMLLNGRRLHQALATR